MDSNKSTTIGILLILLVFLGWMLLNRPTPPPATIKHDSTTAVTGTTPGNSTEPAAPATASGPSAIPPANLSSVFKSDSAVPQASKSIETPLFSAKIGSKGASLTNFTLKKYKTWNGKPVDLINQQR